jgi:hypothetical protein
MLYEISNPSDPYTCEAELPAVAAVAVLMLGQGYYGATDRAGENALSIFAFSGWEACEEFIKEKHGIDDLKAFQSQHSLEIAACLDTVTLGGFADYAFFKGAMELIETDEKRAEFRNRWQDRCSSMNDIGASAWRMAANIREHVSEEAASAEA